MGEAWAAEIVSRMYIAGITRRQLASKCGYTNTYISEVLHGKKGNNATRTKISEILAHMECQGGNNEKNSD